MNFYCFSRRAGGAGRGEDGGRVQEIAPNNGMRQTLHEAEVQRKASGGSAGPGESSRRNPPGLVSSSFGRDPLFGLVLMGSQKKAVAIFGGPIKGDTLIVVVGSFVVVIPRVPEIVKVVVGMAFCLFFLGPATAMGSIRQRLWGCWGCAPFGPKTGGPQMSFPRCLMVRKPPKPPIQTNHWVPWP